MVDNRSTLKFLLCSDIHEAWQNLDKVVATESQFDFVLVSGDQATGHNVMGAANSPELNRIMEESNRRIVEALTAKLLPGGKLFFIPGNHDAESLFTEPYEQINEESQNIHNSHAVLAPGLRIYGLGGSLPTLFKLEGSETWQEVFIPYPYLSETAYTQALHALLPAADDNDDQILLMTHDTPQDYATGNANKMIPMEAALGPNALGPVEGGVLGYHKFGSLGLAKILEERSDRFVVNVHGHAHDGAFTDTIRGHTNRFPVINPGSLSYGDYGIITLTKTDGKWRVSEATKKFL